MEGEMKITESEKRRERNGGEINRKYRRVESRHFIQVFQCSSLAQTNEDQCQENELWRLNPLYV